MTMNVFLRSLYRSVQQSGMVLFSKEYSISKLIQCLGNRGGWSYPIIIPPRIATMKDKLI